MVDHSVLKTNQASIVLLLLVAFVLNIPALVGLVTLAMLVGTARPNAGPFRQLYLHVLRPAGILRPRPVAEDPAPHRFAMGMGAACLVIASGLFGAGVPVAGWVVAWVVVALAGINLAFGLCMGCFVHYQLRRLGILGPARREGRA